MQLTEKIHTHDPIQVLSNGTVLVDYGPMHMFISVFENGKPLVQLAKEGASMAIQVLEDLARFLPVIKKKSKELEIEKTFPDVVRRMIEATKKMEEPDLTPLAAVAGTASDVVADFAGMTTCRVSADFQRSRDAYASSLRSFPVSCSTSRSKSA